MSSCECARPIEPCYQRDGMRVHVCVGNRFVIEISCELHWSAKWRRNVVPAEHIIRRAVVIGRYAWQPWINVRAAITHSIVRR